MGEIVSTTVSRADGPKPLSGVRILELGIAIAAPFCTRQLATFGAEVLKVESPNNPDVVRILGAAWARGDDALTPIQTEV